MKTKMTPEQIKYHQDELENNFGDKLSKLKKQFEHDIMVMGRASPKTIKARDKLMKEIMDKKHEKDKKNGF